MILFHSSSFPVLLFDAFTRTPLQIFCFHVTLHRMRRKRLNSDRGRGTRLRGNARKTIVFVQTSCSSQGTWEQHGRETYDHYTNPGAEKTENFFKISPPSPSDASKDRRTASLIRYDPFAQPRVNRRIIMSARPGLLSCRVSWFPCARKAPAEHLRRVRGLFDAAWIRLRKAR
jgi:hypothetical protein